MLVFVLASLLPALMAPVASAHDDVAGTPDVTIRVDAPAISDQSVVVRPGAIVEPQAVASSPPSSTPGPASVDGTAARPSPDPSVVATVSNEAPLDLGRIVPIGAVVLLNLGAALLFTRTVGGAARRGK